MIHLNCNQRSGERIRRVRFEHESARKEIENSNLKTISFASHFHFSSLSQLLIISHLNLFRFLHPLNFILLIIDRFMPQEVSNYFPIHPIDLSILSLNLLFQLLIEMQKHNFYFFSSPHFFLPITNSSSNRVVVTVLTPLMVG